MKNEDLLKCPLLQKLDSVHRGELLGLLNEGPLREELEKCLASHTQIGAAASVPAQAVQSPHFEPEGRSWRSGSPLWRRSNKE